MSYISIPKLRIALSVPLVTCYLLLVAACGDSSDNADKVSLQLDWTPNTNHIGIYVALANGWYEDAGIEVDILPYSDAGNADAIVANGNADFGVSFPPSLIFSRAAGLDLVSVAAVLQKTVSEIAVLDSSDIRRPRDLDGKTYAGFGAPDEEPRIATMIKADGGSGSFDTATLSTAAYEALYNKRADFTEIFTAWEGIEAEMRGIKLRTFRYDTYGIPKWPSVILVAKRAKVTERRDVYRRFLEVTARGYELAAREPEQAARIFLDYLPDGTFPEADLVVRSTKALAPVYGDTDCSLASGSECSITWSWGRQEGATWDAYTRWLLAQNVVVDGSNRVVTELSGGPLFTNQLLTSTSASR